MENDLDKEWIGSARVAVREGHIEESAGKRCFYLIIDDNRFLAYEKRMLRGGGCPYTLPVSFINYNSKMKVLYDFTENLFLEDYIIRKRACSDVKKENQIQPSDSLEILSNILTALKGMESYLLFYNRISLDIDSILINPEDMSIVFAFVPNFEQEQSLQNRVINLAETIRALFLYGETDKFFEKFINTVQNKNLGLDGMICVLGEIQREICYIYWSPKDFRNNGDGAEHEAAGIIEEKTKNAKEPVPNCKSHFMHLPTKAFAIQLVFAIILISVYISGALKLESFAGLMLLSAGMDLWIMRKLRCTVTF